MRREEFWLVTTRHLADRLLFRDAGDFVVGMNYVAAISFKCRVRVAAFVLMSNHLHLVVGCSREQAVMFCDCFKRDFSRYLNKRYGDVEVLRRNQVGIKSIPFEDDAWSGLSLMSR